MKWEACHLRPVPPTNSNADSETLRGGVSPMTGATYQSKRTLNCTGEACVNYDLRHPAP